MPLIFAILFFSFLCVLTFFPAMRTLYARNPAFMGMILTLFSCFLGVYAALEFSRSGERFDRMARAATLMEMTRESLAADRMEARLLAQFKGSARDTAESAPVSFHGSRMVDGMPNGLGDLLNNGAIVEQISPQSLKVLLACQAALDREARSLAKTTGRKRRHHLNGYLRELSFAQGVLAAEAEFQRGNIGRGDLTEILRDWAIKNDTLRI